MAELQALADSIVRGDRHKTQEHVHLALKQNVPMGELLNVLRAAMEVVGKKFEDNEFYIPEVLVAARAMNAAMEVLEPKLSGAEIAPMGKIVIGTVRGDLHDIGKNLVASMLKGAGFEMIDLGVDVDAGRFAEAITEYRPEVMAMSTLLTTTMPAMQSTIEQLQRVGLRDGVKIMVGGAPLTQTFADMIGADGYAEDASRAVQMAKKLLQV